jgi:hypothetical protein
MNTTPLPDEFSTAHAALLEGRYDCVDRIVLLAYDPLGHHAGGFRTRWRRLRGGDEDLDDDHIKAMAGAFSRRVQAWARAQGVPVRWCGSEVRKHEVAKEHLPRDPGFTGVFLILVAKAPALMWRVRRTAGGALHLEAQNPRPQVNHYHFHIMDAQWGHLCIKMSGYPPFDAQIMLNGHEWVERAAAQSGITAVKEHNCFTGGDLAGVDALARSLGSPELSTRLAEVANRWIYSACLLFGLTLEEQKRTGFTYEYSVYQIEYSRNLLFGSGAALDEVYQGLIDRTRRVLDVRTVRTLFGWKRRSLSNGKVRKEKILQEREHDLTVFKIHFGKLTLKVYDKGERVLRVEAVAHNSRELRCGRSLPKAGAMVEELRRMSVDFLAVLRAADTAFLEERPLDELPRPSQRGSRRLAGVSLENPRLRQVSESLLGLAAAPAGFTHAQLAAKVRSDHPAQRADYSSRSAAYDTAKLRGKGLVEKIAGTRRLRLTRNGVRLLCGLLILREKVIRPVLAGLSKAKPAPVTPPPKPDRFPRRSGLDDHYHLLCTEMQRTFQTLHLAA